MQIHHFDQQKAVRFESDFCASCASHIATLLPVDPICPLKFCRKFGNATTPQLSASPWCHCQHVLSREHTSLSCVTRAQSLVKMIKRHYCLCVVGVPAESINEAYWPSITAPCIDLSGQLCVSRGPRCRPKLTIGVFR